MKPYKIELCCVSIRSCNNLAASISPGLWPQTAGLWCFIFPADGVRTAASYYAGDYYIMEVKV